MKEIGFFDLIDILKENRKDIKVIEKSRVKLAFDEIIRVEIKLSDDKKIVDVLFSVKHGENFDLNSFINLLIFEKKIENIFSIDFHLDIITRINETYLVRFFDKILIVRLEDVGILTYLENKGKIIIELSKNIINKAKYFQVENDFDIVKELL